MGQDRNQITTRIQQKKQKINNRKGGKGKITYPEDWKVNRILELRVGGKKGVGNKHVASGGRRAEGGERRRSENGEY